VTLNDEFAISASGNRNTAGVFGAEVTGGAGAIAQRAGQYAGMSLPVRIMAVKAGQPRWTMEEAE
jgi:hypothetical protein